MKRSDLAARISVLRNEKGFTQKELAELCNVDIRTIQRIESGEVVPRKHTLKLLANILETDLSNLNTSPEGNPGEYNKEIKRAFVAGLIFSINGILVVFDLITGSLGKFTHTLIILIHITTCVFFYGGFYFLGKQYKNRVMEISFLLSMILLPLINVIELLVPYYLNPQLSATVFTVLCINAIFGGLSLFMEASQRKDDDKSNFLKIGGVITIIISGMFLSSNFYLVSSGLIISLGNNLILVKILYSQSSATGRENKQQPRPVLA